MAVNMKERGTVGCAYYVAREEKLYCMEDMKLGDIEAVQACTPLPVTEVYVTDSFIVKTFVNPTTILIPYSIDEAIINLLDPDRNQTSADDSSGMFLGPSNSLDADNFRYVAMAFIPASVPGRRRVSLSVC